MIFRKIKIILILVSFGFSAPGDTLNNNFNSFASNQNYAQYYPPKLDNSVLFIAGVYGFGLDTSRKNYAGANIMIKSSQSSFFSLEVLQMQSKLPGSLSHKNNILTGQNVSYMANMMFGLRLKPFETFAISPYLGMGANALYVDYLAASTFTSGIDMTYVASSYLSVSVGYKNIVILFVPTPDIEHYVNTSLQITF